MQRSRRVTLPSMRADLHASSSALEWVIAGYGLAFAVLLIVAGRLGDLYGRRRACCAGLAMFVIASGGEHRHHELSVIERLPTSRTAIC